jgi:hypothetical protein
MATASAQQVEMMRHRLNDAEARMTPQHAPPPPPPPPPPTKQVEELLAMMSELKADVGQLQERVDAVNTPVRDPGGLQTPTAGSPNAFTRSGGPSWGGVDSTEAASPLPPAHAQEVSDLQAKVEEARAQAAAAQVEAAGLRGEVAAVMAAVAPAVRAGHLGAPSPLVDAADADESTVGGGRSKHLAGALAQCASAAACVGAQRAAVLGAPPGRQPQQPGTGNSGPTSPEAQRATTPEPSPNLSSAGGARLGVRMAMNQFERGQGTPDSGASSHRPLRRADSVGSISADSATHDPPPSLIASLWNDLIR